MGYKTLTTFFTLLTEPLKEGDINIVTLIENEREIFIIQARTDRSVSIVFLLKRKADLWL
jgi:hypothetical protein